MKLLLLLDVKFNSNAYHENFYLKNKLLNKN